MTDPGRERPHFELTMHRENLGHMKASACRQPAGKRRFHGPGGATEEAASVLCLFLSR